MRDLTQAASALEQVAQEGATFWGDHREVPLEVLRDFVRSRAEITSLRQIAAEIGLGRTTLHSFINEQTRPHPRVRRQIALWYLGRAELAEDIDLVRPYSKALGLLVAQMPEELRESGITAVLNGLASSYAAGGMQPPRWVALLRMARQRRLLDWS